MCRTRAGPIVPGPKGEPEAIQAVARAQRERVADIRNAILRWAEEDLKRLDTFLMQAMCNNIDEPPQGSPWAADIPLLHSADSDGDTDA